MDLAGPAGSLIWISGSGSSAAWNAWRICRTRVAGSSRRSRKVKVGPAVVADDEPLDHAGRQQVLPDAGVDDAGQRLARGRERRGRHSDGLHSLTSGTDCRSRTSSPCFRVMVDAAQPWQVPPSRT